MQKTECIVDLTSAAAKHIRKTLDSQKAKGLRLSIKRSGCSGLAYITDLVSEPKLNDLTNTIENIPIYIDPLCVKYIKGTLIDFVDHGLGQTKLVFQNPNVAESCGCGESFFIDEDEA